MKTNKICTVFILFFALTGGTSVQAGGIVGTGAGIVEMDFQYAYFNLSRWISSCQNESIYRGQSICEKEGRAGELFARIQEVLKQNRSKSKRLVFESEKEKPELFNFGANEINRVASTELHSDAQIFVNVDMLYVSGQPAFQIPQIASILLHEVGHQAGEEDHNFLDQLGAQLRLYLEGRTQSYVYELGSLPELLVMNVLNQTFPARSSRLFFHWSSHYAVDLTKHLTPFVVCLAQGNNVSGFEISNAAFVERAPVDDLVEFHFVLKVYCIGGQNSQPVAERKRIAMVLTRSDRKGLVEINQQ